MRQLVVPTSHTGADFTRKEANPFVLALRTEWERVIKDVSIIGCGRILIR